MTYVRKVIEILKQEYPDAKIALNYGNELQLLIAVILSAQCTDERVNMVTPLLFAKFPDAAAFANCKIEELEKAIYSTGFYKNKAKNIKAMAQMLIKDFGGKVPNEMEDLLKLPGVARKTANVVMWSAFDRAEGIVVDTHVARLCGRLGLVSMKMSERKDAVNIEKELQKIVPRKNWGEFSHLLIFHGRRVCVARKPRCSDCVLNKICPSAFKL